MRTEGRATCSGAPRGERRSERRRARRRGRSEDVSETDEEVATVGQTRPGLERLAVHDRLHARDHQAHPEADVDRAVAARRRRSIRRVHTPCL